MKNITDFCTIQLKDKVAVHLELESNSVDYINVIFIFSSCINKKINDIVCLTDDDNLWQ